ncbi:MAG TPA: XRE family transcriptional regulator [Thermoanaerobaculia bacterium]|nr:XRE family transcriptional regulator [Thermoanaerobaculia bacterium]
MKLETLGANLRRLRELRGLTQVRLAEEAGVSRASYRNIELGRSQPRVGTLQAIASALDVRLGELFVEAPRLERVRFRSNKKLRLREHILADVARRLADYAQLEELVGERLPFTAPSDLGPYRRGEHTPRSIAEAAREQFGLEADEVVRDLPGLLEQRGVKVLRADVASDDFFGLSVAAAELGPAIVVNTWDRIAVERWIFTAAHELGHLLLHLGDYEREQAEERADHEREANEFASHFLMPAALFTREWDEARGMPFLHRVLKVKRIFRVSYRTVLYRLREMDRVTDSVWVEFQMEHQRLRGTTLKKTDEPAGLRGGEFTQGFPVAFRSEEPENLLPSDFLPDRLHYLVRKGIENAAISLDRGAEILGLDLMAMRNLARSWHQ